MPANRFAKPLSAAEAEEIAQELEQAENLYRQWLNRFQTMLVCRTRPCADDIKKNSHSRSKFGKWCHGKVNTHLRQHPVFKDMVAHHRQMHREARKLARAVHRNGRASKSQYRLFLDSVDTFKLSMRVLRNETQEFMRYLDPLTGIANRFVMLPNLEQERERIKRTAQPCSVGMMDLDHFKAVNDTYGHHSGDRVLREVAQYLQHHVRRYDSFYRYGGEEFLLLMPGVTPTAAKRILDRLRRGLNRHPIHLESGKVLNASASFGIAPLAAESSVKRTIRRADRAMYAAKKAGRNRVHLWDGNETAKRRGTKAARSLESPDPNRRS